MKEHLFLYTIIVVLFGSHTPIAKSKPTDESLVQKTHTTQPPRTEVCDLLVALAEDNHGELSAGKSLQKLRKEIAIELVDQNAGDFTDLVNALAVLANEYVRAERSSDDLKVDLLYKCVTTENSIPAIVTDLLRQFLNESQRIDQGGYSKEVIFNDDGTLPDESYRALLGDSIGGTQALEYMNHYFDGELSGCGYRFSHLFYDRQYSSGRPVKLSGSFNLYAHPVAPMVASLKRRVCIFRGEQMAHQN